MAENPKKYDAAFKSLSDADPRGLLDIFGVLPHGMDAEVEALPRDIAARPLVVDSGYFVRPAEGPEFLAVFEALTSWKPEIAGRLASYGAALGDKYKMPIRVYPLPMAPKACPKSPPEFGRASYTTTKRALEALTECIGYEMKGKVAVNCIRLELSVWSEGYTYTLPDMDFSDFEDPVIMSDATLWLCRQPLSYTSKVLTIAEMRAMGAVRAVTRIGDRETA